VRASGVRRVCVHKGISQLVPSGSPRDVGPAAAAFPDLDFLIYHSGYEVPLPGTPPEGPYTEATAGDGTNPARAYGLDLAAVRARAARDDLAWVRAAAAEWRARGVPEAP
jgi:hypothetical protein